MEKSQGLTIQRFIPTPVGNIRRPYYAVVYAPVHPPHLWGTSCPGEVDKFPTRFIPTPVGNIRWSSLANRPLAVHPHTCGEHAPLLCQCPYCFGSSPHLWGTWILSLIRSSVLRFIPTPVGNILSGVGGTAPHAVHPHTCGEHLREYQKRLCGTGSSPHLWGTYFS